MSAATLAGPSAPKSVSRRRSALPRILLGLSGLLVLLAVVRAITGANDLTSSGTVNAAIGLAVPIGMAGLGGLWSERAGVVNIGLEGMLILGTFGAGWFGYQHGPWVGMLAGVLLGGLGGLLHAIATVLFGVDHIVSGVAINILGLGATRYLAAVVFSGVPGGGETQSPRIPAMPRVSLPGLDQPLLDLERKNWFLLSDLAGVLRGGLVNVSWLTVIAIVMLPLSYWILWRTSFGLRLRSCGENPWAAESLGVKVYRYKFTAVIVSGLLAGLGGSYLSIVASSIYRDGQTGGRGFIGLAAMIFGNWRPGGLASGAALFGFTDALQLRGSGESIHALLLLVALGMLVVAGWNLRRGRRVAALVSAVLGVLVLAWFLFTDTVPSELTGALPYVTTLVVLAVATQRLRMPASDGLPYRRRTAK